MPRIALVSTLLLALAVTAGAATRLARIFDDHMVLQRDQPVAIFGTDTPGQVIRVAFAAQIHQTNADRNGQWRINLSPLPASTTGRDLAVTGSSTTTLRDVLVGEVWLAAGQSNMDWTVGQSSNHLHPEHLPLVRMANWTATVGASAGQVFGPGEFAKLTPENYYLGSWQKLDAKSVLPQSAVACFFANFLACELRDVPVGIVDISRGGTLAEAFIAPAVLRADPDLRAAFEDPRGARTTGQWAAGRITQNLTGYTHPDPALPHPHPFAPGFLHQASIPFIAPFTFRGVIWYQGESNAEFTTGPHQWNGSRLADYQLHVLQTLVSSWRREFGNPALPFYQVQLPRISAPNRALWPFFREAQSRLAAKVPGVEQAVVTEFGDDGPNVHPANKEPVGERLARIALHHLHGREITWSGPVLKSTTVDGNTIVLDFNHAGREFTSTDGRALREFEIAGADRQFVPATAEIVGTRIHVSSPGVTAPVAVRYAWRMNPDVNFANADGLTASPFRTDRWLATPDRPVRVACVGDSITQGVGVGNPATHSYPARLAILLGPSYEVRNFGKSGAGVHRPSNNYATSRQFRAAIAFQPDLVICNLGINDITHWGSCTRNDFLREYRNLTDAFAASGNAPLIITWHPLAPLFPGQQFHNDPNLTTLNQWVRDAASLAGTLTLDMLTPLSNHPEWFPDHIHPNEAGAQTIAEATASLIRSLDRESR